MHVPLRQRINAVAVKLINNLSSRLSVQWAQIVFDATLMRLHQAGPAFLTVNARPKAGAKGMYRLVDPPVQCTQNEIALVLQGPFIEEERFTIESVRYYREVSPELRIVVSTWDDTPIALLDTCIDLGAHIALSRRPSTAGRSNLNMQCRSSAAGIRLAERLGSLYVAKTRTDQRVYAPHVLRGLVSLIQSHPVRATGRQRERLVSTSFMTNKYVPHFVSDLFMFGAVQDMLDYWTPPEDKCNMTRSETDAVHRSAATLLEYATYAPERYLVTEYVRSLEGAVELSISDWWRILAERFCVVDWAMLNIYWPKYWPHIEQPDVNPMGQCLATASLYFSDWLQLCASSPADLTPPESVLRMRPSTSAPALLTSLLDLHAST